MNVRSLANLFCSHCNEVSLHRANQCVGCENVNIASGNAPVPRPATNMGRRSAAGEQRRIEGLRAHYAARRARRELLAKGRP